MIFVIAFIAVAVCALLWFGYFWAAKEAAESGYGNDPFRTATKWLLIFITLIVIGNLLLVIKVFLL